MRPSARSAHLYLLSPRPPNHPLPRPSNLLSPSPSPCHPLLLRSRIHAFSRIRNKSGRTEGWTDGQTDWRTARRTDEPSYREVWSHLKTDCSNQSHKKLLKGKKSGEKKIHRQWSTACSSVQSTRGKIV